MSRYGIPRAPVDTTVAATLMLVLKVAPASLRVSQAVNVVPWHRHSARSDEGTAGRPAGGGLRAPPPGRDLNNAGSLERVVEPGAPPASTPTAAGTPGRVLPLVLALDDLSAVRPHPACLGPPGPG